MLLSQEYYSEDKALVNYYVLKCDRFHRTLLWSEIVHDNINIYIQHGGKL